MRRVTLVALLLLSALLSLAPSFVTDAAAQAVYSFSWHSEVSGRDREGSSFTGRLSGHGTARVTVTAQLVVIQFDTPLGPARAEIQRDTLAFAQNTTLPFNVPAAIAFDRVGGRALFEGDFIATYAGPLDSPSRTLNVTLRQPGSGPSPEFSFVGAGVLQEFTAWLTSPANGATVSGTVPVGMLAQGGTGTSRTYRLSVDGTVVSTQTVTNGGTASYALNAAGLSNGTHTLMLQVTDQRGAVATDTRTINVSSTTSASAVSFSLTPNQTVRGSVPVQVAVTGLAAGTKRYVISVDGVQAGLRVVSTTTITWYFRTTNWPNGTHRLSVRVTDATGREATGAVNVLVQNQ